MPFPRFHPQALAADGHVFSRAVGLLNIQPMLRVEYTATDVTQDLLTPHQESLEDLGVATGQWDPHTAPAAGLGGADLVVCNCVTSPLSSPEEVVGNLASAAKEGGFLLLHTLLKGDALGETVAYLLGRQQALLSQVGPLLSPSAFSQWPVLRC